MPRSAALGGRPHQCRCICRAEPELASCCLRHCHRAWTLLNASTSALAASFRLREPSYRQALRRKSFRPFAATCFIVSLCQATWRGPNTILFSLFAMFGCRFPGDARPSGPIKPASSASGFPFNVASDLHSLGQTTPKVLAAYGVSRQVCAHTDRIHPAGTGRRAGTFFALAAGCGETGPAT